MFGSSAEGAAEDSGQPCSLSARGHLASHDQNVRQELLNISQQQLAPSDSLQAETCEP